MWPILPQPWYFSPIDVTVDRSDKIYVLDPLDGQIQKYTPGGSLINRFGTLRNAADTDPVEDTDLTEPTAIAVDDDGYIYVTDSYLNRVVKFAPDGSVIDVWGKGPCKCEMGSGNREFYAPVGIAYDHEGHVFVAEAGNHRIQKLSTDGRFISMWGSEGTGNGQFKFAFQYFADIKAASDYFSHAGMDIDKDGNLYVVDSDNNRVQEFSNDGTYIRQWTGLNKPLGLAIDPDGDFYVGNTGNSTVMIYDSSGNPPIEVGGPGYLPGEFDGMTGLAVNSSGEVYIAELLNSRIQKFTAGGFFAAQWTSWFPGPGKLDEPADVTVDNNGNVYVADFENGRVQEFSASGQYVNEWPFDYAPVALSADSNGNIWVSDFDDQWLQEITADGNFGRYVDYSSVPAGLPAGNAIDTSDNLYVVDYQNERVDKFSLASGDFLGTFADGQLTSPVDIAVDNDGYMYILDGVFPGSQSCQIRKFDPSGNPVSDWTLTFNRECLFKVGVTDELADQVWPTISTDGDNVLAVSLPGIQDDNLRLYSLSDASLVNTVGGSGNFPGRYNFVSGTAFDGNGNLYVSDRGNSRIQVFEPFLLLDNARAIVVAGGGPFPGNNLWDTTQSAANFAYWRLAFQGYGNNDITYLSANTSLDLDGDGAPDVDGDATKANLLAAIADASGAGNLVLYLVGHGGDGTFRIGADETITAAELNTALDDLQTNTGFSGRVVLIYEACESGSIVSQVKPPSGKQRFTITSTSPGESALFASNGAISFSNFFWTGIFNGGDIQAAFNTAQSSLGQATSDQAPLLDANGNGIANESADFSAVSNVTIGNGTSTNPTNPVIGTTGQSLSQNTATITADVTDSDGSVERVWAVVRPPDYQPSTPNNPVSGLPTFDLNPDSAGSSHYQGIFKGLTSNGSYQVTLYAQDDQGNSAAPQLLNIAVSNASPRKAVIISGGPNTDPDWNATQANAAQAYTALVQQGYQSADIYYLSNDALDSNVDAAPTLVNVEEALTTWAGTNTQDLVVYLVGQATPTAFQLTGSESLSAAQLDGWLDTLQNNISGAITVVYDADYSGSFVSSLLPASGKQRVVITGSATNQQARFFVNGGVSFSNFFWKQIANGATIRDAWLFAKRAIEFATGSQKAQLNDDGDGTANEPSDGRLAGNLRLGAGVQFAGDEPQIGNIVSAQNITSGTSAEIWVDNVTTTAGINTVWAVIAPPRGDASLSSATLTLNDVGNGRYQNSYSDFNNYGNYDIAVYAKDINGTVSLQKTTSVFQLNGQDAYEDDDSAATANAIQVDGPNPQDHNFYDNGDEDWIKFYALSGQSYEFRATPGSTVANIRLDLYDSATSTTPVASVNGPGAGVEQLLDWVAPANGIYYLRISQDGTQYGADTGYKIVVFRPQLGTDVGIITGIVLSDLSLAGISSANVIATIPNTDPSAGLTDDNGNFYLVMNGGGDVQLQVSADGYQDASKGTESKIGETVDNIQVKMASASTDNDGDGLLNDDEINVYGTDPNNADTDGDGLTDGAEVNTYNTNPLKADSDGDGISDGVEISSGRNPHVNEEAVLMILINGSGD